MRIEPQYMIVGQAVGVSTAIAVQQHISIYCVSIPALQRQFFKVHVVLELPKE
jgi:hypothetical protein